MPGERLFLHNFATEIIGLGAGNLNADELPYRGIADKQYPRINFRRVSRGTCDQWLFDKGCYLPADHCLRKLAGDLLLETHGAAKARILRCRGELSIYFCGTRTLFLGIGEYPKTLESNTLNELQK